ncbi:MAG: hypothetical protein AAGI01_06960 [Myxococcota bacterium]
MTLVAEALITWTPMTFYITAAIAHVLVIYGGFVAMQVDPEHNTLLSALIGAAIIGAASFFLKDGGLFVALALGGGTAVVLAGISGGEIVKALIMSALVLATNACLGFFLVPRTPDTLTSETIGGLTRAIMEGGFDEESIESKEADIYGHVPDKDEDE